MSSYVCNKLHMECRMYFTKFECPSLQRENVYFYLKNQHLLIYLHLWPKLQPLVYSQWFSGSTLKQHSRFITFQMSLQLAGKVEV